jgi:prepilin-type N-terminal cleavage/methylation domain-containing protein
MKKKGFTLIELLVVIAIIALLMGILMPALNKARQLTIQLICGTNLKGLSSAMLVYASYSDDDYPRAGGPGSNWAAEGVIPFWYAPTEGEAFGISYDEDGEVTTPGQATITSSFYLLIKHAKVTPKQFVCKGDVGTAEWKFSDEPMAPYAGMDMTRAWDFGAGPVGSPGRSGYMALPYPGEAVSYTYQFPYSTAAGFETFVIVDMSNPGSPICADRNPYTDKNAPAVPDDISEYNSASHQNKGQNVLYKDGHVKFEDSPCVGISGDNIYLYRTESEPEEADPALGQPPLDDGDPAAFPAEEDDAFLVGEKNGRST